MDQKFAENRVKELRSLLAQANQAYYQDVKPFMDDQEFDEKLKELEQLETEFDLHDPDSPTKRVGGEPSSDFATVTHPVPLLSLDNTYNEEELNDFDRRVRDGLDHQDFRYLAELKFDGASIRLRYEDGRLVLGATRGNGNQGDDITRNIKTIRDIPLSLSGSPPDVLEVRGEVYMEISAFERLNEYRQQQELNTFANPRNSTAGSLKMQDPRDVARRPLRLFCFDLLANDNNEMTQWEKMDQLKSYGLPICKHYKLCDTIEQVHQVIEEFGELRGQLPFETDGVVIKVNEDRYRDVLGSTSKAPRWAIAYKFQADQAPTTLKNIKLQVGRLGKITPVAELDAVQLAGTTVKRASLHNEEDIHRKDIRRGDKVLVEKAGEIIPQVLRVVNPDKKNRAERFKMPENCPACDEELVKPEGEVDWRCLNQTCPPQIRHRIEHFASRDAMDIEGLGEAVVDQLVTEELINNYADLYALKEEDVINLERMAEKSAQNLIDAIEKSKEQPLHRLIYALGIRFVGKTVARDLAKAFGNMDDLMNAEEKDITDIDAIGPRIAESVTAFFNNSQNKQIVEKLREQGLKFTAQRQNLSSQKLKEQSFVLTGSLPSLTRKEATEIIHQHGGKVTSSVSGNTDFLLVGENPGSKLDKAKQRDIPVLDEQAFLDMIEGD